MFVLQVPCARKVLTGLSGANTGYGALNKCSWDTSGTHVAVGDDLGHVIVHAVHESLSQPGAEQWTQMAHTLVDLKHYNMVEPEVRGEL